MDHRRGGVSGVRLMSHHEDDELLNYDDVVYEKRLNGRGAGAVSRNPSGGENVEGGGMREGILDIGHRVN